MLSPHTLLASGLGRIHALTVVHRAPNEALRAFVPYAIALIEADEGFMLMAHASTGVKIGDRVKATYRDFAGTLVPLFEPEE